MKKRSHKLAYSKEYAFRLIGISSHENDYRVCWAINGELGLRLNRTDNLAVFHKKLGAKQEFSLFRYFDEEDYLDYHLISNRCEDGFLLEELKNIDYLLRISGDCDDAIADRLLEGLKNTGIITTAFHVSVPGLKSRDRLLF